MWTLRQPPPSAGFVWTGLVSVSPKRARSGVPYWAVLPNVFLVTGSTLPKFHVQAPPNCLLFTDQNG